MWPTPQDYNEAVQTPWSSFQDAELRLCSPEVNSLGLPKAISGSFASVYQMHGRGGDWAVRCFLHDFGDRQKRYQAISQFLHNSPMPYVVGFEFVERGILVQGAWYPILKMDWVRGTPLITYIEHNLGKTAVLEGLVNSFSTMCKTLQTSGIAHGDLQHGNVMLVGDELRLVDYDCMFVAALAGLQSNEIGHRNYQHPQRNRSHFASNLDNFAAWSIYTSLYCLSKDARLWWSLGGGDDCLLFKFEDYVEPADSIAFRVLEHHELRGIRDAAKTLRKLLSLKVEDIPALGETVGALDDLEKLRAPLTIPGFVESKIASGGINLLNSALPNASATALKERTNLRLVVAQTAPGHDATHLVVGGPQPIEETPWYKNAAVVSSILHPPRTVQPPSKPPIAPGFAQWQKKRRRSRAWRSTLVALGLIWGTNSFIAQLNNHRTHHPELVAGRVYTLQPRDDEKIASLYNSALSFQRTGNYGDAIKRYLRARGQYIAAGLMTYKKEQGMCDFQIGRCLLATEQPAQAFHYFDKAKNEFTTAKVFVPSLLTEWAAAEEKQGEHSIAANLYSEYLDTVQQYPALSPSNVISALRDCAIESIKDYDFDEGARFLSESLTHLPVSADAKAVAINKTVRDLSAIADEFERGKKDLDYARRVRTLALHIVVDARLCAPRTAEIQAYEGMAKNADLAGNHTAAQVFEATVRDLQQKNKVEMSARARLGPSWKRVGNESAPLQDFNAIKNQYGNGNNNGVSVARPRPTTIQGIEPQQQLQMPPSYAPKKITGQYRM